ncbi:MAG: TlpA family protein disulfide reductase [Alphaproteobacteria bacterium]|nr:MAG: TlpA family protein disulfide reductase [Alphaproteobacteria bacterium]
MARFSPARRALLYAALALGANLALAPRLAAGGGPDPARLRALRRGDMRKLVVHDRPKPLPGTPIEDAAGRPVRLSDWRGKVVLVNFWATWCAPCREEMPHLDRLAAELGGPDFAVLTVATGRNPPAAIDAFFEEIGVRHLPKLRDPGMALARQIGVFALPVTLILDRDGREIARMTGDADWAGPDARALIEAILAGS